VDHSNKLPFEDTFFDLVMNRHDFYKPKEVYRILKPEGYFITQQVGDRNAIELNEWFNARRCESRWNVEQATSDLIKCGFSIEAQKETITKTRFYDVGAVLLFLKVICWQIPDFKIKSYYDRIVELHNRIETDGFYDCCCHRFIIVSKKN
jgi:SAM-dependent methyltransferase